MLCNGFKKALAGVLTGAMLLASQIFPAIAVETGAEPAESVAAVEAVVVPDAAGAEVEAEAEGSAPDEATEVEDPVEDPAEATDDETAESTPAKEEVTDVAKDATQAESEAAGLTTDADAKGTAETETVAEKTASAEVDVGKIAEVAVNTKTTGGAVTAPQSETAENATTVEVAEPVEAPMETAEDAEEVEAETDEATEETAEVALEIADPVADPDADAEETAETEAMKTEVVADAANVEVKAESANDENAGEENAAEVTDETVKLAEPVEAAEETAEVTKDATADKTAEATEATEDATATKPAATKPVTAEKATDAAKTPVKTASKTEEVVAETDAATEETAEADPETDEQTVDAETADEAIDADAIAEAIEDAIKGAALASAGTEEDGEVDDGTLKLEASNYGVGGSNSLYLSIKNLPKNSLLVGYAIEYDDELVRMINIPVEGPQAGHKTGITGITFNRGLMSIKLDNVNPDNNGEVVVAIQVDGYSETYAYVTAYASVLDNGEMKTTTLTCDPVRLSAKYEASIKVEASGYVEEDGSHVVGLSVAPVSVPMMLAKDVKLEMYCEKKDVLSLRVEHDNATTFDVIDESQGEYRAYEVRYNNISPTDVLNPVNFEVVTLNGDDVDDIRVYVTGEITLITGEVVHINGVEYIIPCGTPKLAVFDDILEQGTLNVALTNYPSEAVIAVMTFAPNGRFDDITVAKSVPLAGSRKAFNVVQAPPLAMVGGTNCIVVAYDPMTLKPVCAPQWVFGCEPGEPLASAIEAAVIG